ncbi:MlaC/ttg2D family ABC transporter substrate-binding protein [Roseicyclus marinus]|uniref:MlaC/ttg2D family ABC transporter substrate-binding protein n=1 Tax=Roseicyclus marinus TaxID=2161673 RepID=UPI00240FE962|nr:ABC transporter substrate-binding protein [Roseicyclus marinus]MDG3041326.1 ABC transporter substrate-binding protein [Roseicyclus marinus]
MPLFNDPRPTRRAILIASATAALAPLVPGKARAVTPAAATALVEQVASEITRIINSGRSESSMIGDFERMMARYADMPTIAQSVLGPAARSASGGQLSAFAEAFRGYMARKYGRQFREFIGGTVTVVGAQDTGRYIEVNSTVTMPGQGPFEVRFRVWDRSGQPLFIDLLIEGVSLVISERSEIGAVLDRNGGSIDGATQTLRGMG